MKISAITIGTGVLTLLCGNPAQAQLSRPEQRISATVDAEYERSVALLERLVNVNSGTMNFVGVKAVSEMIRAELAPLGFKLEWKDMSAAGRSGHLIATKPGRKGAKPILLIAHLDTVFEADSPFQRFTRRRADGGDEGEGPGAGDDKGGLVVIVAALRAMRAAGTLKNAAIEIHMTGDEEDTGEPLSVSRADLVDAGKRAGFALDFEGLVIDEGDRKSVV